MKAIVLLLLLVNLLLANVAKVTAIKGDVKLLRDTQEIPLTLNFILNEKDTIVTSENGRVQLIFEDNTIISLGKKSTFSIQEYLYDEQKPKEAKATFKVAQGIFKTITGKIGKINPNKFKLKTKSASIGIRGTIFFGRVIPGKPLYVACTEGIVLVVTPEGIREVRAGYFTEVKPQQIPEESKPLTKPTQNILEIESGASENERESTQSSNTPRVQKKNTTQQQAVQQKKPPAPSTTSPSSNPAATTVNATRNTDTLEKITKETLKDNSVTNPDGSLTLQSGTTINTDGTIVLKDGTKVETTVSLTPDGKVTLANGATINPDSTITLRDGTVLSQTASIKEDGTIILENGITINTDGTIILENGITINTDGTITLKNGTVLSVETSVASDGTITLANGVTINSDGDFNLKNGNSFPNGATLNADGSISLNDGSFITANGIITLADGTTLPDGASMDTDGSISLENGTVIASDGSITLADGTTLPDGASIDSKGQVVLEDGTVIASDGSITLANGTTLPDSASINSKGEIVLENGTTLEDGYSVNDDGTITLADGSNVYQDGTAVPPPTNSGSGNTVTPANKKTTTFSSNYGSSTFTPKDVLLSADGYIDGNSFYYVNSTTPTFSINNGVLDIEFEINARNNTGGTSPSLPTGFSDPTTISLNVDIGEYSDEYTGFKKVANEPISGLGGATLATYVDSKHEFFFSSGENVIETPSGSGYYYNNEFNLVFGEPTDSANINTDGISFYIDPPSSLTVGQCFNSNSTYAPSSNANNRASTQGTYINWKAKSLLSYELDDKFFIAIGKVDTSSTYAKVETEIHERDFDFSKSLSTSPSDDLYLFGSQFQGIGGTLTLKDGNNKQVQETYGAFKMPGYHSENNTIIPDNDSSFNGFTSSWENDTIEILMFRDFAGGISGSITDEENGSSVSQISFGGKYTELKSAYITDDTFGAIAFSDTGKYYDSVGTNVIQGWLIAVDSASLDTNGDDKISWGYWALEHNTGASGLQTWVAGSEINNNPADNGSSAPPGSYELDNILNSLSSDGVNDLTYSGYLLGVVSSHNGNEAYHINDDSTIKLIFDIESGGTGEVKEINMDIKYTVDSNIETTTLNLSPNEMIDREINRNGSTAINGFNISGSNSDGSLYLKGKFYGNNAEYTAGTFQYDDGGGSSPTIEAKGVFKAKR